jgi:ribonuclease G
MNEEILINVHFFETRVALLADGLAQELHLQRSGAGSPVGNVVKGRITRVLPGMQAAFVDIGFERPGFLHARDLREASALPDGALPDIRSVLHDGEAVLVQISKEPLGSKGARLSTDLALPSRFLVLMPYARNIGISQRIEDPAERERLRGLLAELRQQLGAEHCGFIARTAAEGAGEADLLADMRYLTRLWALLDESQRLVDAPALVYEELPLHIRMVRDVMSARVGAVRVDEPATFARVRGFVERFLPEFVDRLALHDGPVPLFEQYGVEEELRRALQPRVELRSGGHLLIEQTEAMTTIDVNTGAYVGSRNLEETVFRTNMEAAAVIPRQLRLRNLGGIIVIDFIDMLDPEHQRQVLRTLEENCAGDPARPRISGPSSLGLVEMSRKRTRDSLARQLCEPCPACRGGGWQKRPQSVCHEIYRSILRDAARRARANGGGPPAAPQGSAAYMVRAAQAVIDRLLDEEAAAVAEVARAVALPVRFQVEPSYANETFDLVLMHDLRA